MDDFVFVKVLKADDHVGYEEFCLFLAESSFATNVVS
jgi:hypothetical protein